MRSDIEIHFFRQGSRIGSPKVLNQADVHPDISLPDRFLTRFKMDI
jgi:hypothetical protein